MKCDFKIMAVTLPGWVGALFFFNSTNALPADSAYYEAPRGVYSMTPQTGDTAYETGKTVTSSEQDAYADSLLRSYQKGKTEGKFADRELSTPGSEYLYPPVVATAQESAFPQYTFREKDHSGGFSEAAGAPLTKENTLMEASDLIGMPVRDADNQPLGTVKEAMLDLPSGAIAFIAISPAGSLDMYAVPPTAVHPLNTAPRSLMLNATKDQFLDGPKCEKPSSPDFLKTVYHYYDQSPYWK